MNRTFPAILLTLGGLLVLLLVLGSPAAAQARPKEGTEVDSLIERIKLARARDERLHGDGTKPVRTAVSPDREAPPKETTETEPRDANAEKVRAQRAAEREKMATNPQQYVKDMGTPSATPGAGAEDSVTGLVGRIRASRSEEAEKEKAEREKAAKEGVTRETTGVEPRMPAADVSTYRRFLTPMRDVSGTVGGEALRDTTAAPARATEAGAAARSGELPDPSKDPSAYEARVRADMGPRGDLPAYADKSLLGVYESDRYGRLLSQARDVQPNPGGTNASQAYKAYQALQRNPDTGSIIGQRDVYVPNSATFINPTFRGSIYEIPYSTDPFRRNYSDLTTQSKYSSAGYYNLGVRESFQDYYTREYGVSRAFVPGASSSQNFEVNTVKQWTQQIRQDYGVDIRPGAATYGDLYRIQTGLRKR